MRITHKDGSVGHRIDHASDGRTYVVILDPTTGEPTGREAWWNDSDCVLGDGSIKDDGPSVSHPESAKRETAKDRSAKPRQR